MGERDDSGRAVRGVVAMTLPDRVEGCAEGFDSVTEAVAGGVDRGERWVVGLSRQGWVYSELFGVCAGLA